MTRAIGDYNFRPHIIPEPHTFGFEIQPADKYLLVASDGLWNVSENGNEKELGEMLSKARSIDEAKKRLEEFLSKVPHVDNITVQIIELNK